MQSGKMTFFEEIGAEYTNLILAVISAAIVYLAWRSTYVHEDRIHPTAVLIIDNNRRRLINIQPPENIVRSSSSQSNYSNATEEADIENENSDESVDDLTLAEAPSLQSIIDEVNDLTLNGVPTSDYIPHDFIHPLDDEIENFLSDIGPQHIIEEMDNPDTTEGLRRRRLAFYENERLDATNYQASTQRTPPETINRRENLNVETTDHVDNSHAENCTNENNENENISKIENKTVIARESETDAPRPEETRQDEFRIKLKYLNDELRLVKGTPNEPVGDFKRRNFTVELAAEKLVRLVFNGHVLQPDSKTLKACGLFDNCVVHCLVHNKKPSVSTESDNRNQGDTNSGQAALGASTFSDRNNGGVLFVYLGMVFIALAMVFCWYCRFQYGYLFSWYSTTGLVLMTVIFLIIFPIIVLIERGVTT